MKLYLLRGYPIENEFSIYVKYFLFNLTTTKIAIVLSFIASFQTSSVMLGIKVMNAVHHIVS